MSRYIDADKLKEYFGMGAEDCQECVHNPNDCRNRNDYSLMDFCSAVDEMPTADVVEVKHGKWKRVRMAYGGYDAVCSACNCDVWTESEWEEMDEGFKKFCPNCGARMDGASE